MRMTDLIIKKRDGFKLSKEEIDFIITGYTNGSIPDYQMSSLLMAIVLNGMDSEETAHLTLAMMHSGDVFDLSSIKGVKCDKHSTGGVGDKVSLVLGPLVACCGIKVSKMSGRGLGHTGGTIDKLESIHGFNTSLGFDEFVNQVNEIGVAIVGQTGNLVPADKKIYALRDVTGTVPAIPLIASSIMSKKLAAGSDAIILDVKVGKGAFMQTLEDGQELANAMVAIGKELNRDVRAILTDMNQPLGHAIGNALEVKEAIATLKGEGPQDLETLCLEIGAIMLEQAHIVEDHDQAIELLTSKLHNGEAFNKFKEFVHAQGGDETMLDDISKFEMSKNIVEIKAEKEGYIFKLDALEIGEFSVKLGAGRETKEDIIDMSAGIIIEKKLNDYVHTGDVVATIHSNIEITPEMQAELLSYIIISDHQNLDTSLIKDYIK